MDGFTVIQNQEKLREASRKDLLRWLVLAMDVIEDAVPIASLTMQSGNTRPTLSQQEFFWSAWSDFSREFQQTDLADLSGLGVFRDEVFRMKLERRKAKKEKRDDQQRAKEIA